MIPVIIITEDNRSFNYFNKIIFHNGNIKSSNGYYKISIDYDYPEVGSDVFIVYETNNYELSKKVLELLHKKVAGCFKYVSSNEYSVGGLEQTKFQIYLSDIIQKAKEELEK